jgi:hypothetical protein
MIYESIPGALKLLDDVVPPHLIAGWGIIVIPMLH